MLIYVNQFEIIDENGCNLIFQTISGWLNSIISKKFTLEQLKSGESFQYGKYKVKTFTATQYTPHLYSVLLSHPDSDTHGREWITEIGIEVGIKNTKVSILLETNDISTQVVSIPNTTKPRLVNFLHKNTTFSASTVGLKIRELNHSIDNLRALRYEIERQERIFPIVVVSNSKLTNEPLINPQRLQEQLIGLAQVVYLTSNNSWELEEHLTRRYAAWDGAINIISPLKGKNFCFNKLLLGVTINELFEDNIQVNHHILSYITHATNGYKKYNHFSPTDLRAKRQKDQRTQLKKRYSDLENDNEYRSLAEEAFEQLEEQDAVIEQLKSKHKKEMDDKDIYNLENEIELDELKKDYTVLKMRLDELQNETNKQGKPVIVYGIEKEFYKGEINDAILDVIKSAKKSADKYSRLFDIMNDILKHNEYDGTKSDFLEKSKVLFNNYDGMTPRIRSELKILNLEVKSEGTHNHMQYIADNRYKMTFSKSPSDKRTGNNIVTQMKKALF